MRQPPQTIGNARIIFYTAIDSRHRYTGNTKQIVAGEILDSASGLAICKYEGNDGFYLFGCDSEWEPVTDTWHATIEDAKEQAEFEYEGVSNTWQSITAA